MPTLSASTAASFVMSSITVLWLSSVPVGDHRISCVLGDHHRPCGTSAPRCSCASTTLSSTVRRPPSQLHSKHAGGTDRHGVAWPRISAAYVDSETHLSLLWTAWSQAAFSATSPLTMPLTYGRFCRRCGLGSTGSDVCHLRIRPRRTSSRIPCPLSWPQPTSHRARLRGHPWTRPQPQPPARRIAGAAAAVRFPGVRVGSRQG